MARLHFARQLALALGVVLLVTFATNAHAACCAKDSGDATSVRECGGEAFQSSEWGCRSDARCDWKSVCVSGVAWQKQAQTCYTHLSVRPVTPTATR